MSTSKQGTRSQGGAGLITLEPEENKPADFDISGGDKKPGDNSKPEGVGSKKQLNSKSDLGEEAAKNDIYAENDSAALAKIVDPLDQSTPEGDNDKFNQSQGLLMSKYNGNEGEGEGSGDNDVEIKSNTKLIKCIEWSLKNPLKIIIGILGLIMFILVIIVGVRNTKIGGFTGEIDEQLEKQAELNATHKAMDDEYAALMKGKYGDIYKRSEKIKGQLYDQAGAIEKMMAVYESVPDFKKYGLDKGLSDRLLQVYNNLEETGGPFHKTLKYKNHAEVKVPDIRADMERLKLSVFGFYKLKRLQITEEGSTLFLDAELLAVAPVHWTS